MTIKVLVNGAFGRMGQLVTKAVEADPALTLVGQIGREYNLAESIRGSHADVVVDFTHPDVVYQNTRTILENGARPVIGTSGLTLSQVHELQALARELKRGGVIAPNFSLGAVLMMKCARELTPYFQYAEIIEMHHVGKMDSPSGTALRTAEMIASARQESQVDVTLPSQVEHVPHARGAVYQGVPIHAVRLSGLLAHQMVLFGGEGETVTLRHDSMTRESFMPGVCLACERVGALNELVYGLEGVLSRRMNDNGATQ